MTQSSEQNRLEAVDSLRGLAALSVMLFHFFYRYPAPDKSKYDLITYLFGYFPIPDFYFGLIPVFLFFMISGFVILMTAEKCGAFAEFAYRRFSRLYPVYWGAVAVMCLAPWLLNGRVNIDLMQVAVNLTMLQDYFLQAPISGVFWSLTIELSFYFLVACTIGTRLTPYRKHLLMVWTLLVFFYGFYTIPNPIPWPIVKLLALDYGHFFIYGIAVHELWRAKRSRTGVTGGFVPALIILSLASCVIRYPVIVTLVLSGVYALFYLAVMKKLAWLRNPVLVYLGGISYALYLEHQVVGIEMMDFLNLPRGAEIAIASCVAIAVAAALTRWVERPSLAWLRVNRPAWATSIASCQANSL